MIAPLATCQAAFHSPVQVVMIHTEGPKDGVRIASAIVSLTSPSRHHSCTSSSPTNNTTSEEDVILAVGGDGTLSEVVNGIAHASLRAYLAQLQQQQQSQSPLSHDEEEDWNEIESFYASSESGATGWTSMVSPAVRTAHVTAALTRYAPKLVYLAAGTGADFARLGYACRSVADVLRCLPSLHTLRQQQHLQTSGGSSFEPQHEEALFVSSLKRTTPPNAVRMLSTEGGDHDRSSLPSAPLPSLSMPSSSHTSSHHQHRDAADSGSGFLLQGITVHKMDVCSTIFLRTKRRLFYINECSVGLSSDVIERTDRFKKIRWLALFGGFVVFFCAALVTLIKLSPVAMRMRLFQQAPVVSSSSSSCADAPSAPQEGTSATDPCAMSSSPSSSSTQQQRLLIRHEPSPFPTSAAPQPSPPSLTSAANRPHHQQSPSQSHHHHHHHHAKWNKEGVTRDLASLHGQWVSFPASTIVFCNGRFFGGGMQVGPHGDPRSRSLAVTIWHASFWPIIVRVASVYTGSHTKWSATATMSGVRYEVDSGQEGVLLKCELDGELPQQESLPVVVEVAGWISMLCPSPPLRK